MEGKGVLERGIVEGIGTVEGIVTVVEIDG